MCIFTRSDPKGAKALGSLSIFQQGAVMPRGDKSKYTDKQKRQAEQIAEGYEDRGVSEKVAKSRAWATVNAMTGGELAGSGRGKKLNTAPAKKGGRLGGRAVAARPAKQRVASAKKAAATRASIVAASVVRHGLARNEHCNTANRRCLATGPN